MRKTFFKDMGKMNLDDLEKQFATLNDSDDEDTVDGKMTSILE